MATFRKKPVKVEAVQLGHGECPQWFVDALRIGQHVGGISVDAKGWLVFTLEGVTRAVRGDWLIRGVKGEIYSCKPDIFAETYELVFQSGAELAAQTGYDPCRDV